MYVAYYCDHGRTQYYCIDDTDTDEEASLMGRAFVSSHGASPSECVWLVPGTWEHLLEEAL